MTTIFYIGDSTVARNLMETYPQTGMSQGLDRFLRREVHVSSHAKNGRSTKSFLDEGRLEGVRAQMQPGDFLFIQFGHNDAKADEARHTDPETSFRENLRSFLRTAREVGAHPLLITPIARRLFDEEGNFLPGSHGAYPEAIRIVGREEGVPVADLTALTEQWLPTLGDEASKPLFMWPIDNTHLKPEGAVRMAGLLADCLRELGGPYAEILTNGEDGAW